MSRTDTEARLLAAQKAAQKLTEIHALLQPMTVPLTTRQRTALPHPPANFAVRTRRMADSLAEIPEITGAAKFDPDRVLAELAIIDALTGLASGLEKTSRVLADALLSLKAESWRTTLAAYGMAKVAARQDGRARAAVEALAPTFPKPSKKRTAQAASRSVRSKSSLVN